MILWSQRLEDAIPADHPVRLLDELPQSESFAATFRTWEREYDRFEGQPPYHPRDLSGLYLYGMLNRLRSSRQLESACSNRLDVIWLLSGQKPDHSTIAGFVTRHGRSLRKLFRGVLAVGLKAGLIKLEHVATDGTKIEADAGKGSVRSQAKIESWLGHPDEKIAALQAEWEKNERQEATLFGEQAPWAPRGSDTPEKRLVKMQRPRITTRAQTPLPVGEDHRALHEKKQAPLDRQPPTTGRTKSVFRQPLMVAARIGYSFGNRSKLPRFHHARTRVRISGTGKV